ncbi:DEAD/DEAH box helicase family protein [Bartonella sp. 220]|uniref:DEAD/DEAH box helicase n=1 Tax=Bartonella sp. 220B TaxID=2967260 RepID=UPI0022A9C911|nr:type ISP restriction/modification enzyme [Bartonella sp. 220B]MCZ2159200.1 DEAD/DEAH box helicase family protein [Bartonella sp. 220B]
MLQSLNSDHKQSSLRSLLQSYRQQAKSPRELGTLFENLVMAYLTQDPLQCQEYEQVQTYCEWAKERSEDGRDIGIDLVAKIRDEGGYAAIQCKCYEASHCIKKEDLDSFIAASGKKIFTRRILIDSTESDWSDNASHTCEGQEVRIQQINLFDLEKSQIDWSRFEGKETVVLKEQTKKKLLDHQIEALEAVCEGLQEADRGKLIMACGTGKTFTSLKIAEQIAGKGKRVLFLVPSLALMSQTIREWTLDTEIALRSFAVCSDTQVGKRRKNQDDIAELDVSDLALPATTDPQELASKANKTSPNVMTVVFSTYHSIQVISDAQKKYALPEFDLIICDEAHRTTGVSLGTDNSESKFVKVHDNSIVQGKKRLYMTATPKIFTDNAKKQANEINAVLASMDDEDLYGKTLYTYTFSKAVQNELLAPYKIIVLGVNEEVVAQSIQHLMTDDSYELTLDDETKLVGCYQALSKIDLKLDLGDDPNPMHRALAFCKDIKTSENICRAFNSDKTKERLRALYENRKETPPLDCTFEHIDGTCSAKERTKKLDWLKEDAGKNVCRVLSNVRCLSEGVDVPALDAVMFLHPRKSHVDVIQAVGRIMRRAKGKKRGYIILPVGVPAGISAEQALRHNKRYKVVWQVINALLAHDENFEITLNQMILGQDVSHTLEIIALDSMTAVEDKLSIYEKPESTGLEIGTPAYEPSKSYKEEKNYSFCFEFPRALKTLLAKKFAITDYWENWAGNVAEIAQNHINRLQNMLADETSEAYHAFHAFHEELKNNLNSDIKQEEAVEMLAQHLVTRPVFEALFDGNQFVQNNVISQAMEKILAVLDQTNIEEESTELKEFYSSVKLRASGITTPQARQNLIITLYESFFAKAFPRTVEKLGIVYTPIEVVDFIIHSVDDVLRKEFGQSLGSRGVSILDPFTGTGTFITRLLQSDLIKPEDMEYKFRHDIHANEIVLLAYYIAAINIEATYHGLMKGDYIPFKHIGLTDTFQRVEKQDLMKGLLEENSAYLELQKKLNIEVIFGNPPYSTGQKSANDNAKNTSYPLLDNRIRETYAAQSNASLIRNLYDSYIRAIRWASDRIKDHGVIGFVTNASFVDANSMTGLRKCFVEEFSSLYIFHLRGNQRTSGELSRKEGGKIFGSGSRAPIAISILVKNPNAQQRGKIYFRDIGDYLTREEKLTIIESLSSIDGITRSEHSWKMITPDAHGDWINQRDDSFKTFIALGDKNNNKKLFEAYSCGIVTSRDAWAYNSNRESLAKNMKNMIAFYNCEVKRFNNAYPHADRKARTKTVDNFVNSDARKISWSLNLKQHLTREKVFEFEETCLAQSLYRPFTQQWFYYNRIFNEAISQIPRIFPMGKAVENRVIQVTGVGAMKSFSVLMAKNLPNFDSIEKSQCFPLYLYEDPVLSKGKNEKQSHLFANATEETKAAGLQRRDAITDEGLAHFKTAYPNETITKDDIFYYVYGLLHSKDYRTRYADNLSKELPRIPCVKSAKDFWKFVNAGRELGNLHVNYESVEPYPVTFKKGNPKLTDIPNPEKFYYVTEMKFAGNSKEKDKSTVIYNRNITITDIPLEAYEYIVNGKPALEWVMGRQCIKTDKKSGIVNDANCYAVETIGNPAYPLELFQRVITVSLETMKIVKNLPNLELRKTE